MSRILNKIYEEFPKVEVQLSKVVELAGVSDLVSVHKQVSSANKELKDNILTYRSFENSLIGKYKELEKALNNSIQAQSKADSIKKEFEKAVNELGVKASSIKEFDNLNMALESGKDFIEGGSKIKKPN